MLRRKHTVFVIFLASALIFLLVVLYNVETDETCRIPLCTTFHIKNHDGGVVNNQQKVLKSELRTKIGQEHSDAKLSKTLHSSNNSDGSLYLVSSSNFSDEEVRERPSDLTGDNAREVRASSSTDNDPQESDDDDDIQDNVHGNDHDNIQGGPLTRVLAPNHVRGLSAQTQTKPRAKEDKGMKEMEGQEEVGNVHKVGVKRLYLNHWDEQDPDAWKTLPLVTDLTKTESQTGAAVVYNRVGKCGSRSVISILRQLAIKNQFHLVSSLVYNQKGLSTPDEKMMVNILSQVERPYIFQRHVFFIDFRRYRKEQPKYINIVRDPLSRMVSQYYFKRFGDGKSDRGYTAEDKYQTFDECVLKQMEECRGKRAFYIIPFFCGQDPRCSQPTEWSLNEAIRNVQDFYVAVGLLEELENTFKVFEAVLPNVFSGAGEIYRKSVSGELQKNITATFTKHKVKPSPEVVKIMKEDMKLEYIFYEFIKNRFHMQKRDLGIS